MPNKIVHCAISRQRTGKEYSELHDFIDEWRGINHRVHNHAFTVQLKQQIFDKFGGQEAVEEWLYHVALDSLDTLSTREKLPCTYHFRFRKDGYIECSVERPSFFDFITGLFKK